MIELIVQIANQVGISSSLLLAICTVESDLRNINNYNDRVEASLGICQVQLTTARSLVPHADRLALQQVEFNLTVAALYIKKLSNKYELIDEIISSYNMGSVKKINGVYSNQSYVDKALALYYSTYDKNKIQ